VSKAAMVETAQGRASIGLEFYTLKPNSITLAGSKLLRTSFEPASVMEFGF